VFNLVVRVGGFLDLYSGSNWNRLDSLVIGSKYRRRITLWMLEYEGVFFFSLYSRLGGLTSGCEVPVGSKFCRAVDGVGHW